MAIQDIPNENIVDYSGRMSQVALEEAAEVMAFLSRPQDDPGACRHVAARAQALERMFGSHARTLTELAERLEAERRAA